MGTWGAGVYENDHALDLCYAEVRRLAGLVEEVFALEPVAFDDLEGPLLYIHMLLLLAQEREIQGIDRGTVEGWKKKYLHIFNTTIEPSEGSYNTERIEVITREFDSLAARLQG